MRRIKDMRKFAIMAAAVGVLAFTLVSLAPPSADAGWRRKALRNGYAPGVSVYVGHATATTSRAGLITTALQLPLRLLSLLAESLLGRLVLGAKDTPQGFKGPSIRERPFSLASRPISRVNAR